MEDIFAPSTNPQERRKKECTDYRGITYDLNPKDRKVEERLRRPCDARSLPTSLYRDYKVITLLHTTYKVLSNILLEITRT